MGKQERTKKSSKKEIQKAVFEKLSEALAGYKADLKEKKFNAHLKKASKLFAADIAKAAAKQTGKAKKLKKKPTTTKPVEATEAPALS